MAHAGLTADEASQECPSMLKMPQLPTETTDIMNILVDISSRLLATELLMQEV